MTRRCKWKALTLEQAVCDVLGKPLTEFEECDVFQLLKGGAGEALGPDAMRGQIVLLDLVSSGLLRQARGAPLTDRLAGYMLAALHEPLGAIRYVEAQLQKLRDE